MKNWFLALTKSVIVLTLLCLSSNSDAQDCQTLEPTESEYLSIPWYGDENSYTSLDYKYDSLITKYGGGGTNLRTESGMLLRVPLKFWLYQAGPGIPGGPNGDDVPNEFGLQIAVDRLNNAFRDNDIDIRFFIKEVAIINEPAAVDLTAAERPDYAITDNDLTSLNVWVPDAGGNIYIHGFNGVFVERSRFITGNNSTLTHEIGHYFGLLHTFNFSGWPCLREPVSRGIVASACPPALSRRCAHTGDLLCDTPADPNMSENGTYNANCTWDSNGIEDAYGDEYEPDLNNYMAYNRNNHDCRTNFSSSQKKWMVVWAFGFKHAVTKGWLPSNNDKFDSYEPDNAAIAAREILIGETQEHTFHSKGREEEDWMVFTAPACATVSPLSITVTEVTSNAVDEVAFFVRAIDGEAGAEVTASQSGNTFTLNTGRLNPGQQYLIRVTPDNLNSSYDISIPFSNSCISGPVSVCASGNTFSVPSLPSGSGTTVTWSVDPTNLFGNDTGTGNNFTTWGTNSSTSGNGTITATFSGSGGSSSVSKSVWIGKPLFQQSSISGPTALNVGNNALYTTSTAQNASSYQWVFPDGGFRIISGQGTTSARIEATGSTGLKVIQFRAYNSCGYRYNYTYVDVQNSSGGGSGGGGTDPCTTAISVSPNPVKKNEVVAYVLPPGGPGPCDELVLQDSTSSVDSFSTVSIEKDGRILIINQVGEIVYDKYHRGKKINIRLHKLDAGVYVLYYLYNDEELLSARFIRE